MQANGCHIDAVTPLLDFHATRCARTLIRRRAIITPHAAAMMLIFLPLSAMPLMRAAVCHDAALIIEMPCRPRRMITCHAALIIIALCRH